MLAIFRSNGTVSVYINELSITAKARTSGASIIAGQLVRADDIVDIQSLDIGVHVPDDCGVLFLTSEGWRKALYFDFTPSSTTPRSINLADVFGQIQSYLIFQDRLRITDGEWDHLFAREWFPFIGLSMNYVVSLLEHIRADWNPDDLTDRAADEIRAKISDWRRAWSTHPLFHGHHLLIDRAVERFLNDDYISATSLLYPRIEGILRGAAGADTSQVGLSQSAAEINAFTVHSPMLPARFRQYVQKVYFRSFDPASSEHAVSRHTVGHGVASENAFNKKAACLGLLIIQQLFFSLRNS